MGFLYLKPVRLSIHVGLDSLPAPWIDIEVPEHILIRWGLIIGRTMSVLGWGLLNCAVTSFAVKVVVWVESSVIVFVNNSTAVLLACVASERFASAIVWSWCVSVKNAVLTCVDCILATYPLVFEVMYDLRVSLNALAKWDFKFLQVFFSISLHDHSWQSSWYSPHFLVLVYAIETIWAGVYGFCTATASWFQSILDELFNDGLAWNWLLRFLIDFIYVIVFHIRVLIDKVSQNLKTCDFCESRLFDLIGTCNISPGSTDWWPSYTLDWPRDIF